MSVQAPNVNTEEYHPYYCSILQAVTSDPVYTPCTHVFDNAAIKQWLEGHNSCPTCKRQISVATLIPARRVEEAALRVLNDRGAAIEAHLALPQSGWSRGRKYMAIGIAAGAVASALLLTIYITRNHYRVPFSPTSNPTAPPLDPLEVCARALHGPDDYVSHVVKGLFDLFATTVNSATNLLCPGPSDNSTLIVDAAEELNSLASHIGHEIASSVEPNANQSVTQTIYNFVSSCYTNSGSSQSPISISAVQSLHPSAIKDKTLKTVAYSCLHGVCQKIGVNAIFNPAGTAYNCTNIFSNVQHEISKLGAILKW